MQKEGPSNQGDYEIRRKNLVYISGNIREGICLKIWQGILKKTRDIDANLICYAGGELGEDSSSLVYNLINVEKMDGFIGHATSERDMYLLYYEKFRNRPFVALSQPISGYPAVINDSYHIMREIVEHLIKVHSYTKIAFARGPENQLYTEQRFNAYKDVIQEYNLFQSELITPPLAFNRLSGKEAVRILLDERGLVPGKDLEAIVFVSDMLAVGAVKELKQRGIDIPGHIAVTGINADREACCTDPTITTARLPFADQGVAAVELLLKLINKEEIPKRTILPGKLILGQSCGCRPDEKVIEEINRNCDNSDLKHDVSSLKQELRDSASGKSEEVAGYFQFLLDALFSELEENHNGFFLHSLNDELFRIKNIEKELLNLKRALLLLKSGMNPYFKRTGMFETADYLWNKAKVVVSGYCIRATERKFLRRINLEKTLREISQKFLASFSIEKLLDILSDSLSELEIPSCYISLFEDSGDITSLFDPPENAKLIFAFEKGMRNNLDNESHIYPSRDLLPEKYINSEKSQILIVHSLNYNATQIGFAVFELGPEEGFIYFALSQLMSSALEDKYKDYLQIVTSREGYEKDSNIVPYLREAEEDTEPDSRFFYSRQNPTDGQRDFVLYGGLELITRENTAIRNLTGSCCLEIVTGGRGEISIQGTVKPLFPGSAYILNETSEYSINSDQYNPLKKYFIVFQGEKILSTIKSGEYEIGQIIQLDHLNDIVDIIEMLFKEAVVNNPFRDNVNREFLYLIIYKLLESKGSDNVFINIYSERFQKCKTYIDKNYLSIHTMDDIVKDLNIQKTYICRLFKMFDHESPYQYLLKRKMNHAYNLLTNTNTLIRIIAAETGFDDPYHFSKVFKKMFKISPREARQMNTSADKGIS